MRPFILVLGLLLPIAAPATAQSVTLKASLYYAALEQDYASGDEAAFRDIEGRLLRTGSAAFLKAASIEGTAAFANGMVLNYDTEVGSDVRWMRTNSRFGLDARGCDLVPFRSAAVDPTVIPLGSKLFIAQTKGMPLPGGRKHDGTWIATDEGVAGRRIDLFVGKGIAAMTGPENYGITYLKGLKVEVVGANLPCP